MTGESVGIQEIFDYVRATSARYGWIRKVWCFGSHARGDATRASDVDLAVEEDPRSDEWIEYVDRVRASAPTLRRFDLVRWSECSEDLRESIRAEGVIIYERQASQSHQGTGQPQ